MLPTASFPKLSTPAYTLSTAPMLPTASCPVFGMRLKDHVSYTLHGGPLSFLKQSFLYGHKETPAYTLSTAPMLPTDRLLKLPTPAYTLSTAPMLPTDSLLTLSTLAYTLSTAPILPTASFLKLSTPAYTLSTAPMLATAILLKLSTHRFARLWYAAERPRELHFTRWASKFDQVINPCIYNLEHGAHVSNHVSNRHFAKVINPSLCPAYTLSTAPMLATAILLKLSTHRCARLLYAAERPRELHVTRWAS